jgi:purine-nucleoside/S-methyl-5'-thioadenosine phosphorylase / adenosine deaminase
MSRALVIAADWPAPPGVQAVCSMRGGGVSSGPYASLNVGAHVGDDPGAVARNRARLAAALALPGEPCWLEQVHGAAVADLDREGSRRADAALTRRAGVVCAVLSADCLPIVLAERTGPGIAIAHGGWRGLAAGVLENAVARLAVSPATLVAWLGPAIGAGAYEVGDEVRAAFLTRHPGLATAFYANARGRWQADLVALARGLLGGVGVEAVHGGGYCTYTDSERFFSHRREAPCGRMATLVWRSPSAAP